MSLNRRFWKPSLTSQFAICPIPFHMDTYRGCQFNCSYCFARDFVTFSRRNSEHKEFGYLEGNDPRKFEAWLIRTLAKTERDYTKGEEIAVMERLPLKIGATADPFPGIEREEKVTYDVLRTLHAHDYPTEIQTKNPGVLAGYSKDFVDPNWTIAVTLISTDEAYVRACEPNAPSAKARLEAIKRLTDEGKKVMVKIQPAIYPKVMEDLPDLVEKIAAAGCWAFNTEGLKIRCTMPKDEQAIFATIGEHLGVDIRARYMKEQRTGSDWELKDEKKMEYVKLATTLAQVYGLKYFSADNNLGKVGDGCECCGTQALRNYTILGKCLRSMSYDSVPYASAELEKVIVNFTRNERIKGKTVAEVVDEEARKLEEKRRKERLKFF